MTNHHTSREEQMSKSKVAITIDDRVLARLDELVALERFPNRSQAIEIAIREKITRLDRSRLARECALLDPDVERRLADEDISGAIEAWPEY